MEESHMEQDEPEYDQERARSLIGKHVLIGLSYYDHDEVLLEQVQLHGHITAIDERQVTVELSGSGEECTLPPDLSAFSEAPPGDYRLRSTGEVVTDPDLLTQWNIRKPPPDEADPRNNVRAG